MLAFEVNEKIAATPTVVWRHLTDPALMGVWMFDNGNSVRPANQEPLALGTQLIFKARGAERMSEVVEFEEGRRLALRTAQGSISATYVYEMTPDGARSRVTLKVDCVAHGLTKLFAPLIRPRIRISDSKQLEFLKKAIKNAGDKS
jgi:uncharacterized protein YndB with AHSA1/START domain